MSGQLVSLKLLRAGFRPGLLKHVLKAQTLLTRLEYEIFWRSSHEPIDLHALRRALDQVTGTLRYLSIQHRAYTAYEDTLTLEKLPIRGSLGPMKNFSELVELDISLILLWGHSDKYQRKTLASYLPHDLQILRLNDDMWSHERSTTYPQDHFIHNTMWAFLGNSERPEIESYMSSTPRLKEVGFDGRWRELDIDDLYFHHTCWKNGMDDLLRHLVVWCKEKNLNFTTNYEEWDLLQRCMKFDEELAEKNESSSSSTQ